MHEPKSAYEDYDCKNFTNSFILHISTNDTPIIYYVKTMTRKEKQQDDRINIERRLTSLEERLTEILENHLPHLETKLDRLQWLIVTTLVAIIASKFL